MTQPAQDPETAAAIARLAEQVAALDRFVNERINAQDARVGLALAASDRAVNKAEAATEKRFESVNEFRQTLSDQTRSFISKVEFEAVRDTNSARIADLSSRLDKAEGLGQGVKDNRTGIYAALGAAVAVIAIIVFAASLITAK